MPALMVMISGKSARKMTDVKSFSESYGAWC
jgi:hypothetical protein